jgi:chromosome segregation ATPase
MTQTAALTHEERAEIRALAEQCAWASERLDVGDVCSAIAATNLDAAAATILRLLDTLEAAERERDRLNVRLRLMKVERDTARQAHADARRERDEARRMLSPGERC